jgi:hypothetical protein
MVYPFSDIMSEVFLSVSVQIYLSCYARDSHGISLQDIYLEVINLIFNSDNTLFFYELYKDDLRVLSILNTYFKTYDLYTFLIFLSISD